ncbi:MAG: sugar phosphate nucleotidyltransferase [Candidatus Falkowbacteria bacterium]
MKLIILAGGSGTRLWPVSRKNTPKQTNAILGEKTLLEKTYDRLRRGFEPADIYIATNQAQAELIQQMIPELPADHYIVEPCRRDTAAAIGLAMSRVYSEDPNAVFVDIYSDHYIKDEADYLNKLRLAEKVLQQSPECGVLIGIKPTYPETGYGYIKMGEEWADIEKTKIFQIDAFKEKPDLETAQQYFEQWEYLWNIGCFMFRVDRLYELYRQHLPEMAAHLDVITAAWGKPNQAEVIVAEFEKIEPISMDYGIIEKASNLLVIPADFGWADVGHWRTVKEVLASEPKDNVLKGNVVEVNSEGNLVYSYTDKLITLVGVKDMVVIDMPDTLLICPQEKAQDVKQLVDKLKNLGEEQYL